MIERDGGGDVTETNDSNEAADAIHAQALVLDCHADIVLPSTSTH